MRRTPTFWRWLHQQRHRSDPVGDLARDALADPGFPRAPATLDQAVAHLDSAGAADTAVEALRRAFAEWQGGGSRDDSLSGPFLRGHGRDHAIAWSTHLERCPWCRRKRDLTHLELYSLGGFVPRRGWRLEYPRSPRDAWPDGYVVAVVSHAECGPDTGYPLRLDELAADPNHWYRHLSRKTWGDGEMLKDLIWDVLLLHRRGAYPRFRPQSGSTT